MKKFVAGPCVIESAELLDTVAARLVEINNKLGTDIIFTLLGGIGDIRINRTATKEEIFEMLDFGREG